MALKTDYHQIVKVIRRTFSLFEVLYISFLLFNVKSMGLGRLSEMGGAINGFPPR